MSIQARLRTDSTGNITVHMEGGLDYENGGNLRQELIDLTKQNPASTITLDLNNLEFVGSSGIGYFVETIRLLNKDKKSLQISNVKNEFMKVFKLYDFDCSEIICNEFDNDETFNLSQNFSGKKHTFQN